MKAVRGRGEKERVGRQRAQRDEGRALRRLEVERKRKRARYVRETAARNAAQRIVVSAWS